ncbi:SsgA family sporulation/cell division regulator [Streptomyces sp. NBC_01351]|uniref:SsgA family sporulation/cell division regulator n=1 Tax=Streptomyces sp. NBC_01351 TaxID=2903833 RepID=UPI002E3239B8|nr:SsgA family sporulation/cell division regulator [Streptomyces sp. NBC_01351]
MAFRSSVAEHDLTRTIEIHQLRTRLRFPLRATFRWRPEAPLEVALTFHAQAGRADVTWVIGRDLLARGVRTLTGEGDVRIQPTAGPGRRGQVLLRLGTRSPALFTLDRAELHSWLEDTWAVVPAGTEAECLDWEFFDGLLADR